LVRPRSIQAPRSLRRRLARRDRHPLGERRYEPLESRVLDERQSFVRNDPLNHPLFNLRPGFALTLDEQWKHPDLAADLNAVPVEHLVIGKKPDRLSPDPTPHARLFESLPRRRLRWPQSFYRPALGNDPLLRLPRGDEEDFQCCVGREPIRKSAVLDTQRQLRLSLPWFSRNVRLSPNRRETLASLRLFRRTLS
jgi:hypothetical protein